MFDVPSTSPWWSTLILDPLIPTGVVALQKYKPLLHLKWKLSMFGTSALAVLCPTSCSVYNSSSLFSIGLRRIYL